jgi:ankyrin repeat protein
MAETDRSLRSNSHLLLLLDGILSQDENSTLSALQQIETLVPSLGPLLGSEHCNPLRSVSVLERVIEGLLRHHPHLAKVKSENDGSLPLHFAASIGNVRVAFLLMEQYFLAAGEHNTKGKIPLHYAAREGRVDLVDFMLLHAPQCATVLTKKHKLPLHFAAGEGHLKVVRLLLKAYPGGALIPSKKGKVAMHFAARWGHLEVAKVLYEICPQSVEALDYDGLHPLHDAAREGQLEMAHFLVHRYPQAMCTANIRGEIPLFAALRSGNSDLVMFLVQSWPQGGQQVLQKVVQQDNVSDWNPAILDMCLRGAVNNFSGMEIPFNLRPYNFVQPFQRHCICGDSSDLRNLHTNEGSQQSDQFSSFSDTSFDPSVPESPTQTPPRRTTTPMLDITLPRSKSPILDAEECNNKRSSSGRANCNKRPRRISRESDYESMIRPGLQQFYQLHAALECSASVHVLECVMDRHGDEQLTQVDDLGRLPLHIAVELCRAEGSIGFIVERVLPRTVQRDDQACYRRDYLGRLALHSALISRADCRIIEFLLEANPSSGVEHCDTVDTRFVDKLPIHMATDHGCDLSTIFLLLRSDPTVVQSWNARAV